MDFVGKQVHNKLNQFGTIVSCVETEKGEIELTVDFELKKGMLLKYPDSFQYVEFVDEELQAKTLKYVLEKKQKKAENEARIIEDEFNKRADEKNAAKSSAKNRRKPKWQYLEKGNEFKTHREAINDCFGYNYKDYQQAYKKIDGTNYAAWFPSIAQVVNGQYSATATSAGWINFLSQNDTIIIEKFEEEETSQRDADQYTYKRIVFAKFSYNGPYKFIGVYAPVEVQDPQKNGYKYELIGTKLDLYTMTIVK